MWGSQGWSQWALQPAMFNDVPHEQIDWAELAKQWIQMQHTPPGEGGPPPPHGPPPVALPPPPGHGPLVPEEIPERSNPPLLKNPTIPGHAPELYNERSFDPPEPPGAYMPKGDTHFWNKPQWEAPPSEMNDRLWNGPPMEQPAPILAGKETFDYGHVHDNPPLAMQTIDYNHMSEYSYSPQMYTPPIPPPPPPVPEHHYDSYWSQINASPNIAPIFLKKERSTARVNVEEESSQIDAAKRKQLPAWIRDGLEKMEQERLKKIEKEKSAKGEEDQLSKLKQLRKDLNLNSPSAQNVPKSKFESDSEGEQTEEIPVKRKSPILRKRAASPVEDTRTEEEKKRDLMLKVRQTLTEVLLSVTNSEMIAIAQEVYTKARSKAPARQLASSTSLTSVAPALRGLASYDSGSDESEVEEEPYQNSSDSEEELYRKIKEKKRIFAIKEKKIIAELERKELEEKIDKEKMNNGTSEKVQKENTSSEEIESNNQDLNSDNDKVYQDANLEESVTSNDVPISDNSENNSVENKQIEVHNPSPKESDSNSSSSSESDSNSSETNKKKSYKESKKGKSRSTKYEDSSSKRDRLHKHSKSRDSDSPDRHKRGRSPKHKSSSRKQKKI